MANQFFEVSGLRIDLSKVAKLVPLSSALRIDTGCTTGEIQLLVFDGVRAGFLAALEAYRESLKPKYQFKDGWYICDRGQNISPRLVLRYIHSDAAYSPVGHMQAPAKSYDSLTPLDVSPPKPELINAIH